MREQRDGISFSLSPYTNQYITEKDKLSLVSTSLDTSGDARLIINTAQDTWRVSAHSLGGGSQRHKHPDCRFQWWQLLVCSTPSLLQTTEVSVDVRWLVLAYLKWGIDGQWNLRLGTHYSVEWSQLPVKSHPLKR